jgi:hypothetical protein
MWGFVWGVVVNQARQIRDENKAIGINCDARISLVLVTPQSDHGDHEGNAMAFGEQYRLHGSSFPG